MGLVLTQTISPAPWTRSQNPLGASPPLTIQLLKKDVTKTDIFFEHLFLFKVFESTQKTFAQDLLLILHPGFT